jgi:hypothetical protein
MDPKGLCGHPVLVQVGGPPNLIPTAKKDKLYDIRSLSLLTAKPGQNQQLFLGAGAAPWSFQSKNGEVTKKDKSIMYKRSLCKKSKYQTSYDTLLAAMDMDFSVCCYYRWFPTYCLKVAWSQHHRWPKGLESFIQMATLTRAIARSAYQRQWNRASTS